MSMWCLKLTSIAMSADGPFSLNDVDRNALKSAATKVSTYATVGSIIGLGLGAFLAFRLRSNRMKMFAAFKATEKPTHVQFANGRTGTCPSLH